MSSRFKGFLQDLFARLVDANEIGVQDIIIYVIGPTGAGKSTFINTATKGKEAPVGHGLATRTGKVQAIRCLSPWDKEGRNIVFVDTPACNHDMGEQMNKIAKWISKRCSEKIKPAGIIYMHRISDNRMTERPGAHLATLEKLCGDDFPQRILLVTTMWHLVDEEKGPSREEKIRTDYWQTMTTRGTKMFRFEDKDDAESAWCAVETLLGTEFH